MTEPVTSQTIMLWKVWSKVKESKESLKNYPRNKKIPYSQTCPGSTTQLPPRQKKGDSWGQVIWKCRRKCNFFPDDFFNYLGWKSCLTSHISSKSWEIRKQLFLIALRSDHVAWLALSAQNCSRCLDFALGIAVLPVGITTEGRLLPASPLQQHSAAAKPHHRFQ